MLIIAIKRYLISLNNSLIRIQVFIAHLFIYIYTIFKLINRKPEKYLPVSLIISQLLKIVNISYVKVYSYVVFYTSSVETSQFWTVIVESG